LMQNADAIAAFLHGEAQPTSKVVTRVEPTVGTLAPVAASTMAAVPGLASNSTTAINDTRLQIFPDFPTAEPVAFSDERFLAKRIDMLGLEAASPNVAPNGGAEVFGFSCGESAMRVEARALAMLHAVVTAPCHPNERVVFHHSGLAFAMMTDATGVVDVMLPALTPKGEITAVLVGDAPLSGRADVTELGNLTRIAVQSGRVPGLKIQDASQQGSFLTTLGDPALADPLLAEVYSVPNRGEQAAPRLEATVLASNCGRTISAQSFWTTANGAAPASMLIKLVMPECDGIGDVVVMPLDQASTARVAAAD
ncbi:MAG: hypothetical protein WBB85_06240, partial [Albidovulum sp.]